MSICPLFPCDARGPSVYRAHRATSGRPRPVSSRARSRRRSGRESSRAVRSRHRARPIADARYFDCRSCVARGWLVRHGRPLPGDRFGDEVARAVQLHARLREVPRQKLEPAGFVAIVRRADLHELKILDVAADAGENGTFREGFRRAQRRADRFFEGSVGIFGQRVVRSTGCAAATQRCVDAAKTTRAAQAAPNHAMHAVRTPERRAIRRCPSRALPRRRNRAGFGRRRRRATCRSRTTPAARRERLRRCRCLRRCRDGVAE